MKTLIVLFFMGLGIGVYAQDSPLRTYAKVNGSLSGIGFSIETPLTEKFLFESEVGLGAGYNIGDNYYGYAWYFNDPAFFFSMYGRFYYNRSKREAKGKPGFLNAGNFVGARFKYASPTIVNNYLYHTVLFNAHWGMQRSLGKYWMFSFYVGLGYAFDIDYKVGTVYPAADIKFSYALPFWGGKR